MFDHVKGICRFMKGLHEKSEVGFKPKPHDHILAIYYRQSAYSYGDVFICSSDKIMKLWSLSVPFCCQVFLKPHHITVY